MCVVNQSKNSFQKQYLSRFESHKKCMLLIWCQASARNNSKNNKTSKQQKKQEEKTIKTS